MKKGIIVINGLLSTAEVVLALERAGYEVSGSETHPGKGQAFDPFEVRRRWDVPAVINAADVPGGAASSPWYRRGRNGKPVRY